MEYNVKECKVITTFQTYEECAQYIMEKEKENREEGKKKVYPFETFFVKVLRDRPVLYDENNRNFRHKFPTRHAWSIVAGYMMMRRKQCQDLWATFQKFANSGVQVYVDLVNYVKTGNGNGWIDVDEDSESRGATVKKEDEVNAVKMEVE